MVHAMVDAEAVDATVHVAIAPMSQPVPAGTAPSRPRAGEPGTLFQFALEAWSKTPGFFTDERSAPPSSPSTRRIS
jgi:hypothetical protein